MTNRASVLCTTVVQERQSECSGLVQTSSTMKTYVGDVHGGTTIKFRLTLPICLNPDMWKMHRLTPTDISSIIHHVPTLYIWLLALLGGATIPSSAIRSSHGHMTDVLISSKSIICKKIQFIYTDYIQSGTGVLDTTDTNAVHHVPPLPRHYIESRERFDSLAKMIQPKISLFGSPTVVPELFIAIDNNLWIPRSFEGHMILSSRVVQEDVFNNSGKYIGRGIATRPLVIMYNGTRHVILNDDSVLFSM